MINQILPVEEVDKHYNRNLLITIFLYGVVAALFFWLAFSDKPSAAQTIQSLGQIGDTLGGVFNPVVSLLALTWLIRSVQTQRSELAATKKALEDSARAQNEQVDLSLTSVRIAALTALNEACMSEVNVFQARLEAFMAQASYIQHRIGYSITGDYLTGTIADTYVADLNTNIVRLIEKRREYEEEIRLLLKLNPHPLSS